MLGGKPAPRIKTPRTELQRDNREVSPGLADLIAKCIESNPSQRYQDAGELADDLRRHLAHQPLRGVPNRSPLEALAEMGRLRQPLALARAAMIALAVAIMAAALRNGRGVLRRPISTGGSRLEGGQRLLAARLAGGCGRSLRRGHASGVSSPWAASLTDELAEKIHRATRMQLTQRFHQLTQELHRTADNLRFHYDPDSLSPNDAAKLEAECVRLWEAPARCFSMIPAMRGR